MKKTLCILFLCLSLVAAKSQNLVPNPGFEIYTQCPTGSMLIYYATPWFQPNISNGNTTNSSSSDLFNSCDILPYAVGVPNNAGGYQDARTGNGYAGMYGALDTVNGREYIEVALLSPLVANRKYCVAYYVSLANMCQMAISNMGAYLSVGSLLDSSPFHAIDYVVPQIENPNGNYLSDTLNWMLVSGNFIASGGEDHITIGNFRTPANTNSQNLTWGIEQSAYYYIDDVSVIYCDPSGVDELSEATINIIPNPATNQFTIENSQLRINSIHIYNVLGEEVLRLERIANSQKAIDISTWKAGVYFVEVETEKVIVRKKVIKSTMY